MFDTAVTMPPSPSKLSAEREGGRGHRQDHQRRHVDAALVRSGVSADGLALMCRSCYNGA
jgi:hypothetical protein